MKLLSSVSLLFCSLIVFSPHVWGFAFFTYDRDLGLISSDNGDPVVWQERRVAFGISLNPLRFHQDTIHAMDAWNAAGADIELIQGASVGSTCNTTSNAGINSDGINSIAFTLDNCGLAWGDVLGITHLWARTTPDGDTYLIDTDISLRAFTNEPTNHWAQEGDPSIPDNTSCYRNAQGGLTCEFYRVVLHELGHAVGLEHPDELGQSVTAVMNSGGSTHPSPRDLAEDDINGIQEIYASDGRDVIDGTARLAARSGDTSATRDKVSSGGFHFTFLIFLGFYIIIKESRRKSLTCRLRARFFNF